MNDSPAPFDRQAVRAHRDRAAADFAERDFLFRETADRLVDRLDDIRREFSAILDLGCHAGGLGATLKTRSGISRLVQCDFSPLMAETARRTNGIATFTADEEALPLAEASFDLITSNLSLHWVNDLPGALVQLRKALKPDGLFLACMLGGATLSELRTAFMEAEMTQEGGVSPRVSPFADVRDGGDLLTRAGFVLPVADLDTIRVSFPNPIQLMRELKGMGEVNAVAERRKSLTRRATMLGMARLYPQASSEDADDTRIEARFDIIWLAGWAPGPGQPKPLSPGSAQTRLADALNVEERGAGETTHITKPGPKSGPK
jgi:SAM-dependent methyltransferase